MQGVAEVELLLQLWGSNRLDDVMSHGHVVAGVTGCVVAGGKGFKAQSLVHQYTSDDVSTALTVMLERHKDHAVSLVCRYLLGWTEDRLARVLSCTIPRMTTHLLTAEELFLAVLLND
ncbi:hypothetical protein [Leptothoe spongobia]|uniref:Uncharacterized protein n=1 Tax=Leptothoe spongobia TAU-MAC 1115 TaxID=1967444 RepID=A0A947GN41_9CYAN|nr:hypothetical protein [Leptothoe spongobia]MBT9318042.1 hypothetical protein [Leptothoe spongobia TAU-MAC 1115]